MCGVLTHTPMVGLTTMITTPSFQLMLLLLLLFTSDSGVAGAGNGGGPRLTVTPPAKVVFSSGAGVVLGCLAEGSPPPTVTWVTREGHALAAQSPYMEVLSNGSLVLRPFPPDRYRADVHAATVRCRASNPQGVVVSPPVTLQAVVWQDFTVRAEGSRTMVGGSALLRCLVPTHLAAHVTPTAWETPTHTIYPSLSPEGRYLMVGWTGDLLVREVTREDAFTAFTCRVRDQLGGGRELTSRSPAKITVQEPGEMTRPVIQDKRRSVTVPEGGTVVLPCVAAGTPTPTVRWTSYTGGGLGGSVGVRLGDMGVMDSMGDRRSFAPSPGSAVLVIEAAHPSDAHAYTCTANNSLGIDQMSVEVVVETRLTVSVTPRSLTADLGGTATFSCSVSDPVASVSWYYNGSPVVGSGRVVAAGRQLIVSGVTHDDPGMFQCQAVRGSRAAQQAAQLMLGDSAPVLHYRFIEQTIQPGPPVSLKCSAVGNPTPSITWTLDGLPIPQSDRVVVGEQVGARGKVVGHVNVSHTRVEDGGRFQCVASNRAGSTAHAANLNIYGFPVTRPLATVTAVSGEKLDLRCPVAGYPIHSYTWIKDGVGVGQALDRRVDTDGSLVIDRVRQPEDAGVYTCTASTKQGRSATGSARVSVLVPPRIEPFSFQDGLSEGMRTRVICGVNQGDSPLTLKWLKDGRPLSLGGPPNIQEKVIDAFSSVLAMSSLTAAHSGRYTCEAHNTAAVVRYTASLTVHVPPTWVLEPGDRRVSRGHSLVVDCVARGHPDPSVVWKKKVVGNLQSSGSEGYRSVELVTPRAVQLSNGSLYIARAEPDHAGTYVCRAENSVTHLTSTINVAVNSAPYFTGSRTSVDVRAGESALLECRVRGDRPLTVTWALRGSSLHHSPRYSEKASVEPGGETVAKLEVSAAIQTDAGAYTCTAHNTYGRNSRTVRLNVHEPPSAPRGLRVVGEGSRAVRVSWTAPDPPPESYVVQFRRSLEGWGEAREVSVKAGGISAGVEVSPLMPATDYVVRVVAVNHLGRSPPSEDLRLTTSAEKPGAPPRDLRAEATGPREVRVSWRPPPQDRAHGTILGYYLGYAPVVRQAGTVGTPQYNFTTVENSEGVRSGPEGEGVWTVNVEALEPHKDYHVVVQAFNTEGAGPLSPPAAVTTREDAPGGTPMDLRCAGLSWDSVQITWGPPEKHLHHGALRGYRLEYERWDGWSEATRRTQTTALTAVLTGLEAATNYSVRVRAYTGAGDGPWSPPTLCTTEEDVPGRPGSVRGVVSGPGSFIVSWAPPARPGGRIMSYTVTWRVVEARMGGRGREGVTTVAGSVTVGAGKDVPSSQTQALEKTEDALLMVLQVDNVLGSLVEVEVVAATRVGEGPPAAARVTLTNTVPAAIYSISATVRAERGRDVTLACGHVGQPRPHLVWTYQGRQVNGEGRLVKGDGGLVVQEAQRQDSGNYTCTVTNKHGTDHITYSLTVLVPPSAPLVLASSSSERSVQVQWKQGDTGGAPITGYTLYYRKDHGAWTQIQVHRHAHAHTLEELECGSRYHVYVVAHNSVGSSPASTTAVVRTLGGAPQPPPSLQFLTPNSSSVTVFPRAWVARGCPITHMVLEYRQRDEPHWVQVSSGDPQAKRVEVGGLVPSTPYSLRVTAVASAGSTTHTYTFTTLTAAGELPPMWTSKASPQWLSVRVLLPLLSSVVALASSLALVCYCVRRKTSPSGSRDGDGNGGGEEPERSANTAARDNKHNLAQREQYYATIRKAAPRDQQSDLIPENAEDIYPYATFQLPDPTTPDPNHIPMYPIYQTRTDKPRLVGAHIRYQKMEGYGEVKRRGSRSRGQRRSRSRSRSRGGLADSGDDYETLGSDTETEHGGVSSRTESSNQLDDIPSIRDHTVYARGPGNKDPRDAVYSRETSKDPREAVYSRDAPKDSRDAVYSRDGSRESNASFQQRIHHNLLYHAESSTSPEPSPTTERKSFPRRARARSRVIAEGDANAAAAAPSASASAAAAAASAPPPAALPPSYPGAVQVSGRPNPRGHNKEPPEVSEAECDRDILPPPRRYSDAKFKGRMLDYSIAV
ncbi:LOW QUALITY PROTEIN: cell adhesion molecule Dscam2-like [Panulirus ornatus]|uniref:LOW QUALITY PROTEIN: cell adhesion molecule Dscam2-like n=1 Tax=Panulirus ornatus TaxID=150431 RepID=UPI003A83B1E7